MTKPRAQTISDLGDKIARLQAAHQHWRGRLNAVSEHRLREMLESSKEI